MAFYVPLGPRGFFFRVGTTLIGVWGGLVYRRAFRRRRRSAAVGPGPGPSILRASAGSPRPAGPGGKVAA